MTSPAAMQNPKYPIAGDSPSKIAPAAPGKPTNDRVCPAKVWRRSTMNHPMAPETTATTVPARSALTMNGYLNIASHSVPVAVEGGRLRGSHNDQSTVGGSKDLHPDSIEGAERRRGDDLVG